MNPRNRPVVGAAAVLLILSIVPAPADANSSQSRDYVANGFVTVFCEGHGHDEPLHEPWCLPATLIDEDEFAIGGAVWDVEDHLGKSVIYAVQDDLFGSSSYTVLGISDHVEIIEPVAGCGPLFYTIPTDVDPDWLDEGLHLAAQIAAAHVTDALEFCGGSTGVATIDLF